MIVSLKKWLLNGKKLGVIGALKNAEQCRDDLKAIDMSLNWFYIT